MEAHPARPVDILLVDDNPGKLLAMECALAPLGQNLVKATSGREALGQLLAREFATIVLDVSMPDIDGFETARSIRSRPRSAHTPIIFVSAVNIDEIDARKGYSLGAVDYIFAPIVPEVLRAKVSVFVELHRKTEEAELHARRLEERTRQLEQSQRQLHMAERMATMGTLCAGLGHDMGNLLLPIAARLDVLRPDDLPEDARENIESIRTCVGYLRKLCGGLRMLALDPEHAPQEETTILDEWWSEISPILRNAVPRNVTLRFDAASGLPPVRLARHRLTQAIFNLVQNAGEALRGRDDGAVRVWAEAAPDGRAVRIGVSDNGPGMSPEVLERCFDPFFTTKTRGISTGLGLALVHGILQRERTRIEATSEPGRGTTFSFSIGAGARAKLDRPVAVISLTEPRAKGFASGLLRGAGFDLLPAVPPTHAGAAVWITEPAADLDATARAFRDGRPDRRVLVFVDSPESAPEGTTAFTLTTGNGSLRHRLREFLSACTGDKSAEVSRRRA